MLTLVALGAGGVVYLLALAFVGFAYGEAPGGLALLLRRLRGEGEVAHRWGSSGSEVTWPQRLSRLAAAAAGLSGSLRRKREEALVVQFGSALQAMAASLRAGASLRNAIERSAADLDRLLQGQPFRPMVEELRRVEADLQRGASLDEALIRFRDRLQLEDVNDFVSAILLCRVRGGNAAAVMANSAEIIQDKIAIRQQILTLTAEKRAEANLITFGPPVMVALLAFLSPDYLKPLIQEPIGWVMIGAGTLMLTAAFLIGRKMTEIEI